MTRLSPAQLARVRETIAAVLEEHRLSYRIEPRKDDHALESLLVAVVDEMFAKGVFNQEGGSPGREGE